MPSTTHRPAGPLRPSTACLLLLLCLLGAGCAGVRYGLGALFRSEADYDALELERAAARADSVPGPRAANAPLAYWTQYRGPTGDGHYAELPLELDWPEEGPPELWRAKVGPAYSSVVVAAGLAITMEQRRDREFVVAFAHRSGELVWEHSWPARFFESMSKEGPRATPAVAGDLVLAFGATGELRCLELATGNLRWRHDLLEGGSVPNLGYGLSASPRVLGDLVIAQGAQSVRAFELAGGAERWRALSEPLAYATPQLGRVLEAETLLVATATRIAGLDPATGRELLTFPWRISGGLTCTQPVIVGPTRVLLTGGYGKGSQLVELSPGSPPLATSVWKSGRFRMRFNEPVLLGEYAYGLDDGTLSCIRVATGERMWKSGSYGFGQLLSAQGHLILMDEEGHVRLLEADPEERRELASFHALREGLTLNMPALAHGLLYVRSDQELACYDLSPQ